MSLPSRVGLDPCLLANRWSIDATLAAMLIRLEGRAREGFRELWPGMYVISGYRTKTHNREVGGVADSLHLQCPALAVDLRVGNVVGLESDEIWAILGGIWRLMGGRWGGTFSEPSPAHFDLGI